MHLFHVSDRADIQDFKPRLPPHDSGTGVKVPVVWAVADTHLAHYLLPRDCPRVCIRAGPATTDADRRRFLPADGTQTRIVIEPEWTERARVATLWLYQLPAASFREVDANAGYHVSEHAVTPLSVTRIAAPLDQIAQRGAVLHAVPDLRAFAAEVVDSSLLFSIIRLRHARASPGVL